MKHAREEQNIIKYIYSVCISIQEIIYNIYHTYMTFTLAVKMCEENVIHNK